MRLLVFAFLLFIFISSPLWAIDWVNSRSESVDRAVNEDKLIILLAGRYACSNCIYMKDTVLEDPKNQVILESQFVAWYCDVDSNLDYRVYRSDLPSIILPLIAIIDPQNPYDYLSRTTGRHGVPEFRSWILGYVQNSLTLSVLSDSGGSVKLPGEGDFTYNFGELVDLEAKAEEGMIFDKWSGSAVDAGYVTTPRASQTQMSIYSDSTLEALFMPVETYQYHGGDGTVDDPYKIKTPTDLIVLRQKPEDYDKHFVLCADVNMAGHLFSEALIAPSNSLIESKELFSGVFDGNGLSIQNLTIETANSNDVALFGVTDANAVIKKLRIENAKIIGGGDVGALIGRNQGLIDRCTASGHVQGYSTIGGLVGTNERGSLINSYSHVEVTAYASIAGGLVGENNGEIYNAYSTGRVLAPDLSGGLVGIQDSGIVEGCYWDFQTSRQPTSAAGMGLFTDAMKSRQSYAGWDVNDIWHLQDGQYPVLKWETPPQAVGMIDDFSKSNFVEAWSHKGASYWRLTSETYHSELQSAQAGSIGHGESSILAQSLNCKEGRISFALKVSSESDYDELIFSIDGQVQQRWSGELDWTEVEFPVTAGLHDLHWEYKKDSSVSSGQDTAWIDTLSQ